MVVFIAVRVSMVCLSPLVSLEIFAIASSAPFHCVFPLLICPWHCSLGIHLVLMSIGVIGGLDGRW